EVVELVIGQLGTADEAAEVAQVAGVHAKVLAIVVIDAFDLAVNLADLRTSVEAGPVQRRRDRSHDDRRGRFGFDDGGDIAARSGDGRGAGQSGGGEEGSSDHGNHSVFVDGVDIGSPSAFVPWPPRFSLRSCCNYVTY